MPQRRLQLLAVGIALLRIDWDTASGRFLPFTRGTRTLAGRQAAKRRHVSRRAVRVADLDSLAFDATCLPSSERCEAMTAMAAALGLPEKLGVDVKRIESYVGACLADMPENPYHSAEHVFDVVQFLYASLRTTGLDQALSDVQLAGLYLGAVGHDLQHTGLSNNFLVLTGHPYLREAEEGVGALESHHAKRALALLEQHIPLPEDHQPRIGKVMCQVIHGTDNAQHRAIVDAFASTSEEDRIACLGDESTETSQLLLQMLMKAADTSNPGRPLPSAKLWNDRVYQEFYAEGDQVREAGGEVNPLHNRETNSIAKASVGFINFHVKDIFEQLRDFLQQCRRAGVSGIKPSGLDAFSTQLESNAETFASEAAEQAR